MSRVGLKPINVPSGVSVTLNLPEVTVKGPKGELKQNFSTICDIKLDGDTLYVTRDSNERTHRSMHGLTRTLLANMVEGVNVGFAKELEIIGVGYKAEIKGKEIVLTLGYSHPVHYPMPEGITIEAPALTRVKVSGIDKQKVGQVAAELRALRPPEPYKGKGIKYIDEQIQRKAGKTAVSGT
ncbi:MAG: 50S ribosomal protein L6 [Candidatus Krumholzibacteriota bacterium]|nr:50S ribosomal protein L6 [Candidatus Krumholzibacteriota bacterium]